MNCILGHGRFRRLWWGIRTKLSHRAAVNWISFWLYLWIHCPFNFKVFSHCFVQYRVGFIIRYPWKPNFKSLQYWTIKMDIPLFAVFLNIIALFVLALFRHDWYIFSLSNCFDALDSFTILVWCDPSGKKDKAIFKKLLLQFCGC